MEDLVKFLEMLPVLDIGGLVALTFGLVQWGLKDIWMKYDPEKRWLALGATGIGLVLGLIWGGVNWYRNQELDLLLTLFYWVVIGILVGFASGGLYAVIKGFLSKANMEREYQLVGKDDSIRRPVQVSTREFKRLERANRVSSVDVADDGTRTAYVASIKAAQVVLRRPLM